MCSDFEAGSYIRLTDFVYHSTLGLRVMKKKIKQSITNKSSWSIGTALNDSKNFAFPGTGTRDNKPEP